MKAHETLIALAVLRAWRRRRGRRLADDTIKVGLLATLEGPFTVLGQDSVRGAELALQGGQLQAGGKKIDIIKGSSDASPDSAVKAGPQARGAGRREILIGPLSGDEGPRGQGLRQDPAERHFHQRHVGCAGLRRFAIRPPNFYRFTTDGAQWMAGLGSYAYNDKGYQKVVTVAEDYSFPYTQVFGFMADFCKAGGHVPKKFWVPIGNKDFSSVIAAIPDKRRCDLCRARRRRRRSTSSASISRPAATAPLIGGSITVDQTVLRHQGQERD